MRVTAHPIARALCIAIGCALVSTSANISGREPIRDRTRLRMQLGRAVDLIVPGALGDQARPTAIRDSSTGETIRAD
jgi:L-threonylcarbamoyladenylate synthase